MATPPKFPPVSGFLKIVRDKNGNITNVELSQAAYQYLTGGVTYSVNVNTGVNRARAEAAAAQAAADSAAQTAQDVQSNEFAVTISATNLVEFTESLSPVTTGSVTVTPSGGTAPYTYAWTKVSGDTLTVNSPAAATTTFTGTPSASTSVSAVYRCTVTDDAGSPLTASVTVAVSISYIQITG